MKENELKKKAAKAKGEKISLKRVPGLPREGEFIDVPDTEGGIEIEEVAERTPEKISKEVIDPLVGAQPYQARRIASKLGLMSNQVKQFTKIFARK